MLRRPVESAQFASYDWQDFLKEHALVPSMSRRGNCHDNAVAESFFSNLKNELLHHCIFTTHEDARAAIFSYIELFYNRQRIHQSLGYRSPEKFEERMVCLD